MFFTSQTYNKFYTEKILGRKYIEKTGKKEEKKENEKEKEKDTLKKDKKTEKEERVVVEEEKESGYKSDSAEAMDTIWIENEKIAVGIKEEGAIITSIKMKEYEAGEEGNKEVIDLIKGNTTGGNQLVIGNVCYDKKYFKYMGKIKKVRVENSEKRMVFENTDMYGNKITKIYSLKKNEYVIRMEIQKDNLPGERISIGWKAGIEKSEHSNKKNQFIKKIVHLYNGESVQHIVMKKAGTEETTGRYSWIGITSKYFFIAINNEETIDCDIKIKNEVKEKNENNYQLEISRIAEKQSEKFWLYAGPTKRDVIKKYKLKYETIMFPVVGWTKIFFWADKWFPWLADKVLLLLIVIQKIVKDYGVSILILTVFTRVITYPMTLSSMKSMEKMKDIQPKVNIIRQKHKNNPQKMNEEIMAMYKKEGVNPLNPGCLPMFLQMPVFISLFVVLRKSIEIRGADTFLIPWIHDLSKPEVLFSMEKILPGGIPMYGTNIALLPIIMAVLMFYQQKMTIKDPNQKAMIYFMPIFMLVLFNSFPSGLVMYWTFSSGLQLVQQLVMNRKKKIEN